MWLKRLIASVCIVSFGVMSYVLIMGVFFAKPVSTEPPAQTVETSRDDVANAPLSVQLTVEPNTATAGDNATLHWSANDASATCIASDDWSGSKTVSGNAPTGKVTEPKQYHYTLTCKSAQNTATATADLTVDAAAQ